MEQKGGRGESEASQLEEPSKNDKIKMNRKLISLLYRVFYVYFKSLVCVRACRYYAQFVSVRSIDRSIDQVF